MNLVDREVIHGTFGRGNVINCDDSYIQINFESGDKRFVFPDVFKDHVQFVDQKAANLVQIKIEEKEEEEKRLLLIEEEEKAIAREEQRILEQEKQMKNHKVNPKIQSVFWIESEDREKVFGEWRVFTGTIGSGKRKGEVRKLARMNGKSACLITSRKDHILERDRQILGVFMTNENFDGRLCEDGYITAHPKYRINLSKEESEKMLFWNYYSDKNFPKKTTWNSGKQRYFDNIWMAQILRDIINLRDESEEREEAEKFFEYFCRINLIDRDYLEEPNGALLHKAEI